MLVELTFLYITFVPEIFGIDETSLCNLVFKLHSMPGVLFNKLTAIDDQNQHNYLRDTQLIILDRSIHYVRWL